MNILSIDTTTRMLSCAVTSDEKCLKERSLFTEGTHSARLMSFIDALLLSANTDISEIDYYACTVGPGSFTGLRIGVSTIKGLAYANGRKVVAVSSLDALYENLIDPRMQVCPLIDARKGEVFGAFYNNEKSSSTFTKSEEFNIAPEELVKTVKKKTLFLGNGALLYKGLVSSALQSKALFADGEQNYIRGVNVAKLAYRKILAGGAIDPEQLLPIYIRESDAELNFKGRHRI